MPSNLGAPLHSEFMCYGEVHGAASAAHVYGKPRSTRSLSLVEVNESSYTLTEIADCRVRACRSPTRYDHRSADSRLSSPLGCTTQCPTCPPHSKDFQH